MSFLNPRLGSGKNIRLFKRDWMEKFTYVHPLFPITFWGSVVVLSFGKPIYSGELSIVATVGMAMAGLMFWSLAEYILHRWVFHFKPRGETQEFIAFMIHGIHHEDPNDARRLLMPPVAAVAIAIPFYTAFVSIFGDASGHSFFAGFIAGYLVYDYTHFAVHFAGFQSQWFKALKHNHMQHHFVTQEARFGVSSTLWDHVFGTIPSPVAKKAKHQEPPQPSC